MAETDGCAWTRRSAFWREMRPAVGPGGTHDFRRAANVGSGSYNPPMRSHKIAADQTSAAATPEKPSSWTEFARNRHKCLHPFLAIEFASEWLVYFSKRWAWVEVLEIAGKFTIVASLVVYLATTNERREAARDQKIAKQFAAWQMLAAAAGKKGDYGKAHAIALLNAEGIPLDPLDLSGSLTYNLELKTNELYEPDFRNGLLRNAKWERVSTTAANFGTSVWAFSTFVSCTNKSPLLHEAMFNKCTFLSNEFMYPALTGTTFVECDMRGTIFFARFLNETKFRDCDLSGAAFHQRYYMRTKTPTREEWLPAQMRGCNLYGAEMPDGFLEYATNKLGAVWLKPSDWKEYARTNFTE
jgi:uncharacterized protein YjbI with pentapeptide repeats